MSDETAVQVASTDSARLPSRSGILKRSFDILNAFRPGDVCVQPTELARRTGLSKATGHRIVQEMVNLGILERSDAGVRIGLRMFEIGQLVPLNSTLRVAALPFLTDLAETTGGAMHLAVLEAPWTTARPGHGGGLGDPRLLPARGRRTDPGEFPGRPARSGTQADSGGTCPRPDPALCPRSGGRPGSGRGDRGSRARSDRAFDRGAVVAASGGYAGIATIRAGAPSRRQGPQPDPASAHGATRGSHPVTGAQKRRKITQRWMAKLQIVAAPWAMTKAISWAVG